MRPITLKKATDILKMLLRIIENKYSKNVKK
jgi:hypothetical protein